MKYQIKDYLRHHGFVGQTITVQAWVRTKRESKSVSFIALNDGSTLNNLQAVVDAGVVAEDILKLVTTGSCIAATGELIESQGTGQSVELKVTALEVYGTADPDAYPLQPKRHSLEFLREIAHLRPRTNTFSAIFRVRSSTTSIPN